MIYGETTKQWLKRVTTPHHWFAWRPVMLQDGRFAWLQNVVRFRSV